MLISFGLGGLTAKKALARLTERYFDPAAQRVSGQLAQVVFIGCPHPTTANAEEWPLLGHVLRSDRNADNRAVKTATEETGIVRSLCVKFHESGIQCPVLTTYETRPTKIRLSLWRSEKRLLIPREFAETGVRGEELVPLNLDPRDIKSVGASTQHAKEFRQKVKLLLSGLRELSVARAAQSVSKGLRMRERLLRLWKLIRLADAIDLPVVNQNLFASTATQTAPSQPGDILSVDPAGATLASTERTFSVGSSWVPYEARKVPQLPYHSFGRHPRNPNFFGRQDIMDKLDGYLLPSQPEGGSGARSATMDITKSCAICGIGGMGKTQIALEYAHSRRSEFDAIMWVQADARTSISASFGTIAMALGLAGESESSDLAVSFSIVMQWLSNPVKPAVKSGSTFTPPSEGADNALVEATWLIIFDNADTIDLLSEFWPSSASTGSVLITTRDPAGRDFCLGNGIMLQPLSVEDAVRFFVEQLNLDSDGHTRLDSASDVGSFVERFGGLPLALVQVASLIRRRQMTLDEFSQLSRRGLKPAGLANYQASQSDGDYQHSIFTVWAFESLDEATKSLLNVMSLMDPFAIQEAILQPQEENAHRLAESVPKPYPIDVGAYVSARSELVKASLISRSLPSRHVELHPLVQEVVQTGMDEEQLRTHFSTAVALIHAAWPSEVVKWGHETSHRERSGQIVPHGLKLLTLWERRMANVPLEAKTADMWVEVLKDSGWYLYERGEHEAALPIFESALELARKREAENPTLMADVLMCLAALGLHTSTPDEVLRNSQEHFEIRKRVHDAYAPGSAPLQTQYDHAMGVATMAMALNNCGEFEKALVPARESLVMYRSFTMYGSNWKTVPYFAVAHTGWCLWSLGRFAEAEEVLQEAVDADRREGNPPSYGLAGLLLPLGNALASQGKLDAATLSHQKALDMYYLMAGDNYKSAQARVKHAEHSGRKGLAHEAIHHWTLAIEAFGRNKYYKREMARAQIKAGRYHLSLGNVDAGQALLYQAQATLDQIGHIGKAEDLDEEAMAKMVRMWSR
ncbi:hypothetical protein B0H66DRAFT_600329 [Apodospora peruviana]|uniref:DUF7779 domain-containing protein n=1 Tax=Apodospora peruviana TaxID=516989 RepID=A0AAE0MC19_9PEZI|nr:hypothetical protein B0H66DRAFT_600329 [Apodospora peruviana]